MRLSIFLTGLVLAACDSPSVAVQAVPAATVQSGGHSFSVRLRDDYAETIRTNPVFPPPNSADVVAAAVAAMEQVSGCNVRMSTLRGDAAMQKARLSCG